MILSKCCLTTCVFGIEGDESILREISELRQICYKLDNDTLVDYFGLYAVEEYKRRHKYEADDERYINCARSYDALKEEIVRRLGRGK